VRENLIFAGKFQLPAGTSLDEIEDLADKVMASLGLSRVMNSMVGDVNRRGVSGGEKKRGKTTNRASLDRQCETWKPDA
jgi:ABC-type multidrug transport system ATPase subunit